MNNDLNEVHIILSHTQPEIVDFTFYTDKEVISKRVDELNKMVPVPEFWYLTLYRNVRELKKSENIGSF